MGTQMQEIRGETEALQGLAFWTQLKEMIERGRMVDENINLGYL